MFFRLGFMRNFERCHYFFVILDEVYWLTGDGLPLRIGQPYKCTNFVRKLDRDKNTIIACI